MPKTTSFAAIKAGGEGGPGLHVTIRGTGSIDMKHAAQMRSRATKGEDAYVRPLYERCNSITVEKIRLLATIRALGLVSTDPRRFHRKIPRPELGRHMKYVFTTP